MSQAQDALIIAFLASLPRPKSRDGQHEWITGEDSRQSDPIPPCKLARCCREVVNNDQLGGTR